MLQFGTRKAKLLLVSDTFQHYFSSLINLLSYLAKFLMLKVCY